MSAHQIPEGGGRGRGGRGERGAPPDAPTAKPDAPTPPPPDPTTVRPLSDPSTPPPPPPVNPPSFLYWVITGLVLLALLLAWYIYKLRLRLASGQSDSGPSLFVSPSAAQDGAIKGIKSFGLDSREKWKPYLLSGGVLVKPLEPVLVQQIDRTHLGEAFYYLVPFGQDMTSVRAVACVDGVTGEYLECSRFEGGQDKNWGRMLSPWRTAASTRAAIKENKEINLQLAARTTALPTDVGVHPQLVWKACKESQSVFLPFRLVKVGNSVRYIRIDGVVFDKLS